MQHGLIMVPKTVASKQICIDYIFIYIYKKKKKKKKSVLVFFLFLHKNICYGYSLDMPRQGASLSTHNIYFCG